MFLSWEAVALALLPGGLAGHASDAGGTGGFMLASLPLGGAEDSGAAGAEELAMAARHADAVLSLAVGATADAAAGATSLLAPAPAADLPAPAAAAVVAAAAPLVMPEDGPGAPLSVDPLQVFVRRSHPAVGSAVETFSFLAGEGPAGVGHGAGCPAT